MTIRSLAPRSGETSAEDHRSIHPALLGDSTESDPLGRRSGLLPNRGTADLSGSDPTATIARSVAAVGVAVLDGPGTLHETPAG